MFTDKEVHDAGAVSNRIRGFFSAEPRRTASGRSGRGGSVRRTAFPQLSIWLPDINGVTLDLDATYEETCRTLRIP